MITLLDALDCGLLLLDEHARVLQANRWVHERCATPLAQGETLQRAFGAAVEPRLLQKVADCLAHGNASRLSQAFHPTPLPLHAPGDGGGERLRQAVDVVPLTDPEVGSARCLLQVRDVTEHVEREQTLREQTLQLSTELLRLTEAQREIERQSLRLGEMARLAPVGLFECDADSHLVYANARVAELLGEDPEPALGLEWTLLFASAEATLHEAVQRWQAGEPGATRLSVAFALPRHGSTAWLRLEGTPLRDADGSMRGHIFTMVDVTELHEQARRHEMRANHDALTGLANRARFEARLHDTAQLCESQGRCAWLLYLDLDGFKPVNDRHGHAAGDQVLQAVARRLKRVVRSHDLVARLGGDEFAVLLDNLADAAVVQRIVATIEQAVAAPIAHGDTTLRVGASVGRCAVGPGPVDLAAVMAAADADMYRVKRARRAPPERVGEPGGPVEADQAAGSRRSTTLPIE